MMLKCGEGIKLRRVALGMTREMLSAKSGVSIMTIRRYEGLEREPRFDILEKLATAMDCTVFDLTEDSGGDCDMMTNESAKQPIAMKIKELRHRRGITQTDLATMIGKTSSSIKKYEMGMTNIPLDVLEQIADALNTTVYSLLGGGESVGGRIRQFRLNKGLSQQQLGDAIGMSQQQIGQYEKGLRSPKLVTLSKFAFGLGCAVSDLLYDETEIEANQGYEIIESETYHMSDTGRADRVVLGRMVTKNSSQFVTWESAAYFQDDRPLEYFWGHYFDKEADARADYHRRLMEKYE